MFGKHYRKKQTSSLINFQDFVKYHAEKEKIITNPFEENWKKAVVFQELLTLYQPHENNYVPEATVYDRKDFNAYYKYKRSGDLDESIWQNNEDYQLKKFYRMVEGIDVWDEQFQDNKIGKMNKQVEARGKQHAKEKVVEEEQKGKKQNRLKYAKHSKNYFSKDNLRNLSNLIDISQKHKKYFLPEKKKISQLKKKAINSYGLNFTKQLDPTSEDINYQDYRKKQLQIYQKFIHSMSNSRIKPKNIQKQQKYDEINQNLPSYLLNSHKHSCSVSPNRFIGTSQKNVGRKKYFRIAC